MTRRNNEARLGMPTQGAKQSAPIPPAFNHTANDDESESRLSYITPTELVDLPSQGKLYPPDSPLFGVNEIEIREMTAREEDILTTQSFIKKGVVFDRLLKSLIVDKSINVGDLLLGDKNALLVAARISGYGAIYDTHTQCPVCGAEEDRGFDLTSCPMKYPVDLETTEDEELRDLVTLGPDGRYLIRLPKSEVTVEVVLITGKQETITAQERDMRKKKKLPDRPLTDHLKKVIVSINGVENVSEISKFIEQIPASDSRVFRRVFSKLTPNVEMTQEFVCGECNYEQVLEVPLTAGFFWPDA